MKVAQFIFGGLLAVFFPSPALSAADAAPAPAQTDALTNPHFRFGEGTAQSLQLANSGVARNSRRNPYDPALLVIRGPLVIYSDGGKLANGLPLASARLTGYYYWAEVSGQYYTTIMESNFYPTFVDFGVSSAPQPGPLTIQNSDRNGFGARIADILQSAAENDQVRAGSFEVRILEVQSLGELPPLNSDPSAKSGLVMWASTQNPDPPTKTFQVLWLKSDPAGADLFFPVGTMPDKALQSGKLYSPKLFQDTLQSFAKPVPLSKEMLGDTLFKQPHAAAVAALAQVHAIRADADIANPATHPALLSDLNVLEATAQALAQNDGASVPASQKLLDDFSLAVAQAISCTSILAHRADESPANQAKSLAFVAQLRAIQNL